MSVDGAPYADVPCFGGVLDGQTIPESWGEDITVPTIEPGGQNRYALRRVGATVVYVLEVEA